MTTAQHRINEFTRRQIYYRNNFTVRLNAIDGKWQYTTFVWTISSIKPVEVNSGKYQGEDPYVLIDIAERMFGKQRPNKLKLTIPLVKGVAKTGIKTKPKRQKRNNEITPMTVKEIVN